MNARLIRGALLLTLPVLAACSGGGASSPAVPQQALAASSSHRSPGSALTQPSTFRALPGTFSALPGTFSALPGTFSALPGTFSALPGAGTALDVCTDAFAAGDARCNALRRTDVQPVDDPSLPPQSILGYHPADLWSAYRLPSTASGYGQTVGVVDAYDDPNAEADMSVYRSTFGLPPCTAANGCFRRLNQRGGTSPLPAPNANWAQEIALDLDMVSAICPHCGIVLVEAYSSNLDNLEEAVGAAVGAGATVVSNSYYIPESAGRFSDAAYARRGIPMTVASGDAGYGPTFPASSPYVTAVGGTSLFPNFLSGVWEETAWSGGGSGCSTLMRKPWWQSDRGCSMRTLDDVAAVGDPGTGVAVFSSYAPAGAQGWSIFGGTSVGAPIIASAYALAGNGRSLGAGAEHAYAHASALFDITSGGNGACGTYLCTAGPGYDGPTGLGSPDGTGAF